MLIRLVKECELRISLEDRMNQGWIPFSNPFLGGPLTSRVLRVNPKSTPKRTIPGLVIALNLPNLTGGLLAAAIHSEDFGVGTA